jgi:hypothetical protein
MIIAKESGHWYDMDGKPMYTIVGANGKERNTTLRDARKLNLVPSVTSIMSVAAKPGLEIWKRNQLLMAALTLPKIDGESLDEYSLRIAADAEEQGKKARETGTEIHGLIESGFVTGEPNPYYTAVREWLDLAYPGEAWSSEKSFASKLGYGGKCDLHSSKVVVDYKTKDFAEDADSKKFVYDEHGMQLSAYGHGYGLESFQRVNIFVRPMKEGESTPLVLGYVHPVETEQKDWEMFQCLLKFWQLSKNYTGE